jgi:phosphoglycolate phosphatase
MVRVGFGLEPEHQDYAGKHSAFLDLYEAGVAVETTLFEGIEELLQTLEARDIPWGIVTNKPEKFVAPLLKQMGIDHYFRISVGGDTLPVKKPDPAPLIYAMEALGGTRGTTVMIGDSAADISAARAAGIPCVAVRYGYNFGAPADSLQADATVDSLTQLL